MRESAQSGAAPALTESRRSFLTAEWRNLCVVSYQVDPVRLQPHLPPGLTLDTRDGDAFVSLVAFDFLRTRVLGVSWPGYRDFPEVNLRMYVREGERRGVAFVRELVPNRLIAWLAQALYNEPYKRVPMRSRTETTDDTLAVRHELECGGRTHGLRVRARAQSKMDDETSWAHFFKEHSWGYGKTRRGALVRYEVRHELWRTHEVLAYDLDWDFGAVYGPEWSDLTQQRPHSVVLAAGSSVRVSPTL